MKKIFFFIIVSAISLQFAYSQNFKNKVLLDSAGDVFITGQTKCAQDSDIVIIRYNASDGSLVWQKKIGLTGTTFFKGAVIKGNYIYISAINNYNGNKRVAIIKSDFNGTTSSVLFDRVGGDYGNAIVIDQSSNIYIAGRSDFPVGYPKFLVLKYTSNLDSVWTYVYSGPLSNNFDEALDLKADFAGNVYVTGYTSQSQTLNDTYDYLTIKLNSSGVLQWAKKYNGPASKQDVATGIVLDSLSNAYVTGYSYQANGSSNYFTIKYSPNGDSLASASYSCGSTTANRTSAITSDNTGNIYITGYGQCSGNNYYDYVTIKYNLLLNSQWTSPAIYSASGSCTPYAISYANSHVYVTGESDSSNGDRKFVTLKYDAGTGSELWRWKINTSDSNYASSVAADQNDNVFASGYSVPDTILSARYSGWLSSYGFCPPFGIRTISTLVPAKYSLYQNFPNPFNPATLIKFDNLKKGNVKIIVYDITGREVDEILNKYLSAGSYEIDWNASGFASGIYIYSFMTDSYTESKKMVLVK